MGGPVWGTPTDGAMNEVHLTVSLKVGRITGEYFCEDRITRGHPQANDKSILDGSIFLIDGNVLALKAEFLLKVLEKITSTFPECSKISQIKKGFNHMNQPRTHRVAVNAYLLYNDNFLLLKRKTHPLLWGPPGGRLESDENPRDGLKREIFEETGFRAEIHMPVTTWFGYLHGGMLLSVDYLATCTKDQVRLSAEHEKFVWQSIEELRMNESRFFASPDGFRLDHYEKAWKVFKNICSG